MLEFYEVAELEKKWEEYNKNRKKPSILSEKFSNLNIKFDKTIVGLLALICVAIGAILWLLNDNDDEISMSKINQNIKNTTEMPKISQITTNNENLQNLSDTANLNQEQNVLNDAPKYNMSTPNYDNKAQNEDRPSLSLKDIGITSSEDSGGFTIKNNYEDSENNQNFNHQQNFGGYQNGYNNNNGYNQNYGNSYAQNFPPSPANQNVNPFATTSIPKNEVIGFGNAPFPPNSDSRQISVNSQKSSIGKIEIKTSKINMDTKNLEEKFYATNNIDYALMLAERAYDGKNYNNAIKWALMSNDIDKENVRSWIIFAKASYKKGAKADALKALQTFNAKANNGEISHLISKIQSGSL